MNAEYWAEVERENEAARRRMDPIGYAMQRMADRATRNILRVLSRPNPFLVLMRRGRFKADVSLVGPLLTDSPEK